MRRQSLANPVTPMKEGQKNKQKRQKHTFPPRGCIILPENKKSSKSLASFQSLVFSALLGGLVVQSVGIRPSHAAAAKDRCNRVVQFFFFRFLLLLLLLLIRFSFSFEPTPKFFSTVEPSLAQILTMSLSKRMCESSHFRVHETMTLVMEESLEQAMSASPTYMFAASDRAASEI